MADMGSMPPGHTEDRYVCVVDQTMMMPTTTMPPKAVLLRKHHNCFGGAMTAKLQMEIMPQADMPFTSCDMASGMMGHGQMYNCGNFTMTFDSINGMGTMTMMDSDMTHSMQCVMIEMQ